MDEERWREEKLTKNLDTVATAMSVFKLKSVKGKVDLVERRHLIVACAS